MNLHQFLLILLARRRIAVAIFLSTVATTVVVSLLLPRNYTATASLVVDVKSPDPIAGMVLPGLIMPGYMATQVDIINSDRVAQRVVKLLKLDESPEVKQNWLDATEGKGKLAPWLANLLQKQLDVKPSRESNVIAINYKSPSPEFSAAVANAFAQAYIDTNIELKVEPARQYADWFQTQGRNSRDMVEKAQAKLSEYQQLKGIVASDERLDNETAKLNEISTQLSIVQGQTVDARSKQKGGSSDTLQEVMQNPLINQLKADIARAEAKLQEAAGNIGKNHPQFRSMESEIVSLKQKLDAESLKVYRAIGTTGRVSKGKEDGLKAALEAQKRKLLELRRERDEMQVLQREVDVAQKAYDIVAQRFTQSTLESQNTQTNATVLTPAEAPLEPSSPKVLLNILIAIFLGTLLGVGAALITELLDRRVRSSDDIVTTLEIPVLAELAMPRVVRRGWRGRLTGMIPGFRRDGHASI